MAPRLGRRSGTHRSWLRHFRPALGCSGAAFFPAPFPPRVFFSVLITHVRGAPSAVVVHSGQGQKRFQKRGSRCAGVGSSRFELGRVESGRVELDRMVPFQPILATLGKFANFANNCQHFPTYANIWHVRCTQRSRRWSTAPPDSASLARSWRLI